MLSGLMQKFVVIGVVLALPACAGGGGGGGGGGGVAGVGGAAGQQCDPALYSEGCFGKARMQCDAASKAWTQIEICGDGLYCAETGIIGSANTMRKTACKSLLPAGAGADAVVAADGKSGDATTSNGEVTANNDAVSAQDQTSGADTADATVDPPQDVAKDALKEVVIVQDTTSATKFSECLAKACSEQWSACGADTTCVTFLACADSCKDSACVSACAQKNFSEATVVLASCASTSGCAGNSNCGNGKCDPGETSSNCPGDCVKATCGNGKCETGETPTSCAKDCGGPVCGNGVCETGESTLTCKQDCPTTDCCKSNGFNCGFATKCAKSCGSCPSGQTCSANVCSGGSSSTCVADSCPDEIAACQADQSCIGIVLYGAVANCADKNACTDNACVQANCSKEMSQCQSLTECTKLISCLSACKSDQACANKCPTASGLKLYQALGDCAQANCP